MIKQLQKKLIRIAMLSVFCVLLVTMLSVNLTNLSHVISRADEVLDYLAQNGGRFPEHPDKAQGAASQQRAQEDEEGFPFGAGEIMTIETPFDTRFFNVQLDEHGAVLSTYTKRIASVDEASAAVMAKDVLSAGHHRGSVGDYRYLVTETPQGALVIFLNCSRSMTSFRLFLSNSIIVSAAGLSAVFLLVVLFSRYVTKPVAQSYENQRRFITDAGHELKTPLTIIDANTEVLELEEGENRWTKSIRSQVKRLAVLTEHLLSLARMDESEVQLENLEFNLSDAVADTVEQFTSAAMATGRALSASIAPDISMKGDEAAIRRLVGILCDNAVKYSTGEGDITLSLIKHGKNAVMRCKNPVIGMGKGDQDMLFERFYRGDASRSGDVVGYGIGLSLARAIVTAHKGRIAAVSEDGESLTITVLI